jgi:hypothetical protein
MRQRKSFGTGDINLAAAMTTLGIPPDPINPVELIARDNGRDYTRFHFLEVSACGKYSPEEISAAWSDMVRFNAENPFHPFAKIMEYIATRPRGCVSPADWQEHAADFLGISVAAIRKSCKDIANVCAASPESPVSYICAFIVNRFDLVGLTHRKASTGTHSNMMAQGKSVSIIPEKAPSRIKDYLLSHLR